MGKVRGENTRPEIRVRKLLHQMGYRFRLHTANLPGRPDIVLPKYKLCIFVNGCFWHQHPDCYRATIPDTNPVFWRKKLKRTQERDRENIMALAKLGWRVVTIWECETKDSPLLQRVLERSIEGS